MFYNIYICINYIMHISYNTFSEQRENEGERNYFNCNSDFTAN